MFNFLKSKKPEERVTQATDDFRVLVGAGLLSNVSHTTQVVNAQTMLQVPAVWAAVNFISGTIAGLPLHVYQRARDGRKRSQSPISKILHDNVSDEMTSFTWRKYTFERILTQGRAFTLILRDGRDQVRDLAPLNPANVTVERRDGLTFYIYKEDGRERVYEAADIIDLPFMLKDDGLAHYGPISAGKEAIGLGLAVQEYSARFFANGGVPPFAVTGNFQGGKALNRASDDLQEAVKRAASEGRQALTLPNGLEIKSIGTDPEKMQMLELNRFCVEQVARLYSIPPTFLQDLTHGTYSNTEQQDLHFVKHTLKRWVEQFEQELNLKLWGRNNNRLFAEFSMDGLLRGDVKTRFESYSAGVQNGILMPNEARKLENLPQKEGGNSLFIQGATVPLSEAGQNPGVKNDV